MKKSILIILTLATILSLTAFSAIANDDLIVNSRGIDLYSVVDCPQTGFVIAHYLDDGGMIFEIETFGPKENVAGLVLELRYSLDSEVQKHQFTIDDDGRSSVKIKTGQLEEQDLEIWIVDTPEMFVEFFKDHSNFVLEDGHMLSLKTRSEI